MSYQTRLEVDAFFAARLTNAAWDDLIDADKDKAILQATWIINQLEYKGCKSDENQTNKFPRNDNAIPQAILDAHSLICNALADEVDVEEEFLGMSGVSSTYANVKHVKQQDSFQEHTLYGVPSAEAFRLLKPYLLTHQSFRINRTS